MKVLLINTSEKTGGAAIACNRLMHALNNNGIEAKMLVRDKQTDDPNVVSINTTKFRYYLNKFRFVYERFIIFLANRFSKRNLWKISIANTGNDISSHPLVKEADILHLHWINQGMLSLKDIEKLTQLGKPIVWTMHDQWAYTGICHYASGCNAFKNHCSNCFKIIHQSYNGISYKTFTKKGKLYKNNNISLIGCSQWIAKEAKTSALCQHNKILSIPNPIDIQLYKPADKKKCREQFHLPLNKKAILFGACKVTDKRKGIDYLIESCNLLSQQTTYSKNELCIIVFGGQSNEIKSLLPFDVINVGYIHSSEAMIALYNAVDLFLIPSLEDNLPNTIMESMACGTPCVGFNIGGIPEMIDHKQNGYVAEYKNAQDLAAGIHWVLNEANYEELSKNAREKVVSHYSEEVIAKQHIELYQKILEKHFS